MTIAPGRNPGKTWLALTGAAVVAGLALFVLFRTLEPPAPESSDARPPTAASSFAQPARVDPAPLRESGPSSEQQTVLPARSREGQDGEPIPAQESDPTGEAAGDEADRAAPSGIALFPPRGSDPVRVGLVVPDGFALPDGFVRHYQVTDDGQELPPILVVHPDYDLLDAQGDPLPRPEGGVVPPELAPTGMPIETLVVPEPPDETSH